MKITNTEALKNRREKHMNEIEASKQRMVEKTGMDRNHPKFESIWCIAWDQGHAEGIQEVEYYFEELAELVMS